MAGQAGAELKAVHQVHFPRLCCSQQVDMAAMLPMDTALSSRSLDWDINPACTHVFLQALEETRSALGQAQSSASQLESQLEQASRCCHEGCSQVLTLPVQEVDLS